MIFDYKNSKIFYRYINRNTDIVNVYLHGWGANYQSLYFCKDNFSNSALFIDFPPFGKSDKEIKGWTIFSYTTMVISLCEHLGIKKLNVFGHSFGGRVAILIAVFCKSRVNKLILIDSAGLKPRRKLSYYLKVWNYKIRKKLHMDVSRLGSCDYLALNRDMQKIFNNIVKTYLDEFLGNIEADTLIVYGKKDKTTPLYMARRLKRKIKHSHLEILDNCGHFCFNDDRYHFLKVINNFLLQEG